MKNDSTDLFLSYYSLLTVNQVFPCHEDTLKKGATAALRKRMGGTMRIQGEETRIVTKGFCEDTKDRRPAPKRHQDKATEAHGVIQGRDKPLPLLSRRKG